MQWFRCVDTGSAVSQLIGVEGLDGGTLYTTPVFSTVVKLLFVLLLPLPHSGCHCCC
jgi:hypothetical protein